MRKPGKMRSPFMLGPKGHVKNPRIKFALKITLWYVLNSLIGLCNYKFTISGMILLL